MSAEAILKYIAWDILWNPFLGIMFLALGLYLTIGMRFFQFRRFPDIMRNTMGKILRSKKDENKSSLVTSFEAFATALGGSVGAGNIAGVSSAIVVGGPGALFWMWLAALVSMGTKTGEIFLSQHYKDKYSDGSCYGGAPFYMVKGLGIERGLKWAKPLAIAMAVMVMGNYVISVGTYSVCETAKAAFGLSKMTTITLAFAYTGLLWVVLLGGIKRIVRFATIVVPFMTLFYLAGGVFILMMNWGTTLHAFMDVFRYAFTPYAAVGGFAGVTIMKSMQVGVSRSVYSNEAGWGSSPIIHAAVDVDHPGRQAVWGAFEVFVDTILVCSVTGLVVLSTGIWKEGIGGAGAVGTAFSATYGPAGGYMLAFAMFLFQMTTSTGWYTYLESMLVFLLSKKSAELREKMVKAARIICPLFPLAIAVWAFGIDLVPAMLYILMDIQTALPVYMNLVALVILSPVIFKLTREFETKFLDPEKAARENKGIAVTSK